MTPEEAEDFYEEDEDPREVFAWFERGVKGVTQRPADLPDDDEFDVTEGEIDAMMAAGKPVDLREDR